MRRIAIVLWWLALTTVALAQNVIGTPISKLPAATQPLTGTELFPLVQNGITKNSPVLLNGSVLGVTGNNIVNDQSLVVGTKYMITNLGSDFTTAGAPTNAVGQWFAATATHTTVHGTGTVTTGIVAINNELLISNIYNSSNAPPGIRVNYTQRGSFSGAASFNQVSCVMGGQGPNLAYGIGTTCFNFSMAPTAVVLDGQGLFVVGQTYKITVLGNTNWNSLGYIGTPVVSGTFVATATQSSTVGGTGQATAPFWTYAGKEFNVLTGAIVIATGNPGATDSDLVATSGGVTVNDTTEGVVSSGHFVVGNYYTITSLGSTPTNFVSIGASANQLGVQFQATGVGNPTTNGQAKSTGSHLYPGFFTTNINGLGEVPIGNGTKVEQALGCFNNACAQVRYVIGSSVQRNGQVDVIGHTITAGAFTVGEVYTILTTGTTDFTLVGAVDSNPGTSFVATGSGAGTGTATEYATSAAFSTSTAGSGGASQGYHFGLLLAQHIPHVGPVIPQPMATDASLIGYDDPTPCFPGKTFTVGPIATGTITSGGSGYGPTARYPATNGGIFLTGGTGQSAIAIINVTTGVVTNVQIEAIGHGVNYTVGDVLSANSSDIGGGSGFAWTITGISQPVGGCPANIANWINLWNVAITGNIFNSPHYLLTGAGDATQNSVKLVSLAGSGSRPVCVTSTGATEAGSLSAGLVTCP